MPILGVVASGANIINESFESIASTVAGSSFSTMTFDNIPQTYTSLQLRIGIRVTQNEQIYLRLNSDTSSTYYLHRVRGQGTTASADASGNNGLLGGEWMYGLTTADILSVAIIDFYNYADTDKNTTLRIFQGRQYNTADDSNMVQIESGLYVNTSAITRIDLFPAAGSLNTGSTFALYGIKAGA